MVQTRPLVQALLDVVTRSGAWRHYVRKIVTHCAVLQSAGAKRVRADFERQLQALEVERQRVSKEQLEVRSSSCCILSWVFLAREIRPSRFIMQVDVYKRLLKQQSDTTKELTERLIERDEQILALKEEKRAYGVQQTCVRIRRCMNCCQTAKQ
eukprot:SAG31_NODE_6410_length_2030_cov_1.110306_2_plen_154_part_00